jgi:hypothetical protein
LTTAGLLVIAGLILALQFGLARHLDRSLPKRKKLPLWYKTGPVMENRRWALIAYPCLNAGLAVGLLAIAVMQDMEPGPRSNGQMILAFAFALVMFGLVQLANVWKLKQWFRKGEPRLD